MSRTTTPHCAIVVLLFVFTTFLSAQTIAGTWQATTPTGENPRIALRLRDAPGGIVQGVFYRIEPTVTAIPLTSVHFQSPNLGIVIAILNTVYDGKLSEDGKSFQGTWTQAKQSFPLTFTLANAETLWKAHGDAATALMSAADPAFEVATIKLAQPSPKSRSFVLNARHFQARNATVADMLKFAYSLRDRQIEAVPAWCSETRFDIDGTPDSEGLPTDDQDRLMLRKLLVDRFQLKAHTIEKVFPAYALTLETTHPQLIPTDPDLNTRATILVTTGPDGQTLGQFRNYAMTDLTDFLMGSFPDRHVVDETGLKAHFDFAITIPDTPDQADRAASILHALQTLGFKLTPKKISLKVLVIDHLEEPSAN